MCAQCSGALSGIRLAEQAPGQIGEISPTKEIHTALLMKSPNMWRRNPVIQGHKGGQWDLFVFLDSDIQILSGGGRGGGGVTESGHRSQDCELWLRDPRMNGPRLGHIPEPHPLLRDGEKGGSQGVCWSSPILGIAGKETSSLVMGDRTSSAPKTPFHQSCLHLLLTYFNLFNSVMC